MTAHPGRRPARLVLAAAALAALMLAAVFVWLGVWQIERRAWKLDLIARVERRLASPPVATPGPADWLPLRRADDEYRRIRATGRFARGRDTWVSASTRLGPGYWLMTPLREARGFTVLVNRGFVPDRRTIFAPPRGPVAIEGLFRVTEPGGDLLRRNDASADLWYSRDVSAIANARRLGPVAPYFIDAGSQAGPAAFPRGGLTVIAFANNHLVYALTWFAMSATIIGIAWAGLRSVRRGGPRRSTGA